MQAALAGLLQRLVDRRLDGVHVGLPGRRALRRAGVHPRDHEDRVALVDQPLDHRLLGIEVEDVVLVDPGRDDHQRLGQDLLGRGGVLDQLEQVVLPDHRAGGDRDVAAHLERVHVGLANQQLALAALEVGQHHLQPADEVVALLVDRGLQDLRVQREEVGGVHRLDELAGVERRLLALLRIHLADGPDGVLDPPRGEQVGLLHIVEERVLGPFLVGEALVGLGHEGRAELLHRLLGADPFQHRLLPERILRRPVFERHVRDLLGILGHGAPEFGKGGPSVERVRIRRSRAAFELAGQELLPDLTGDVEDLGHVVRDMLTLFGQGAEILLLRRCGFAHGSFPPGIAAVAALALMIQTPSQDAHAYSA